MNITFYSFLAIFCIFVETTNGHAHLHKRMVGERESDGAYSPRDHAHMEGDEHHTEFDHEAILGSTREAEEFDSLPPEEAKKKLRLLLDKMDLNKDQHIDRQELRAWILRSFKTLSKEEAEERLDEADKNEDGFVTWEEYVEETYGLDSDEELDLEDKEEEERLMKEDKELWDVADKDKDGKLSSEEYVMFTHPEQFSETLPVVVKFTMEERDLNKDGYIDLKEYIGDRAEGKDKEWLLSTKDKFDNELDKNKDGILDKSEVVSWLIPSDEEIADEEVDHLFGASDDNHDLQLSFDEVLEHHDVFVGSEATDFGEHLSNMDRFSDEL